MVLRECKVVVLMELVNCVKLVELVVVVRQMWMDVSHWLVVVVRSEMLPERVHQLWNWCFRFSPPCCSRVLHWDPRRSPPQSPLDFPSAWVPEFVEEEFGLCLLLCLIFCMLEICKLFDCVVCIVLNCCCFLCV